MIHRHLDIPADTLVEDMGLAALDDLLDRGDLSDWVPLAGAVAAHPEGELAESVIRLCNAHPMYGTSNLWKAWIDKLRTPAPSGSPALGLAALRRSRGVTQSQLAEQMGISQSDVSKLERRADVRVSTLTAAVAALGGKLRISAEFADGTTAQISISPTP